jgi:HD-like signal output (HDOD) protein
VISQGRGGEGAERGFTPGLKFKDRRTDKKGQAMKAETDDFRASLMSALAKRPLPIIRPAAAQVLTMLSNPNSNVEAIANTILHDQAFTTRVLHVANSAYYRRKPEKITTVTQAVLMTGFNTLRDITLAAEFTELVQKRLPGAVNLRRLLAKAFVAGHQAHTLGDAMGLPETEALFTTGLLESVGEFALAVYLPKVFVKIADTIRVFGAPYVEAHLKVTGMTPHEVTEIVFKALDLPEDLLLPPPDQDSQLQWTSTYQRQALVHLANICATNFFSSESPQIVAEFKEIMGRFAEVTGLPQTELESLLSEAFNTAVGYGSHVELDPACFGLDGNTSPLSMRHTFIGLCLELVEKSAGGEIGDDQFS